MAEEQKVVFAHTVEGLFVQALSDKLTPAAKERLKAAGLDLSRSFQPAYPEAQFHSWVRIAAEEVFPGVPGDEALRKMGESLVTGYEKTLMGKAVLATVRMLGPKRMLERTTHNFRSATNYLETKLNHLGGNDYEMSINETSGVPCYFGGIMLQALRIAGAKDGRVEIIRQDGGACTYRIQWT
ncbi:DUF2378 family protein [Pyxidicoccus fallax]|uniref:DUF2378 family protein n=1 Tax=Pyxidicoccus fallax TaxID=394095 RepID=A0A848LWI0_9BACT|nr:DUF2378 family protein [Pyxidicoccus fallax]NMO21970.1 DUF2378 family protein [Pyxidicoccus fallax]NPC83441.1 DUF2378 family protein [Pyxidicoccus fallax]